MTRRNEVAVVTPTAHLTRFTDPLPTGFGLLDNPPKDDYDMVDAEGSDTGIYIGQLDGRKGGMDM